MKNIHLIKEEYIKCGDCNKHYLCTTCGAQCGSEGHFIESTKQETTLDEAAERYSQGWDKGFLYSITSINAFKAGAEWEAKRRYSEEEVLNLLDFINDRLPDLYSRFSSEEELKEYS